MGKGRIAVPGFIDGHAPLLSGKPLNAYLSCRISNCHETTTLKLKEEREKLSKGMQVLIREGTVKGSGSIGTADQWIHVTIPRLLH
jgi:adenine deaminase